MRVLAKKVTNILTVPYNAKFQKIDLVQAWSKAKQIKNCQNRVNEFFAEAVKTFLTVPYNGRF